MTWQERSSTWGKPRQSTVASVPPRRTSAWVKGLLAGAVVVLGGSIACWLLFSEKEVEPDSVLPRPTVPRTVTSKVTPVAPAKYSPTKKIAELEGKNKSAASNLGHVVKAIPAGRRDKVVDKDGNVTYVRHKPPFTNRVDTLVMSAIRPGGFPIGLRQWVKTHSKEQLIAALEAPVNFDKDDSEQLTYTKKCVEDTKAQILQRLKEGHEVDEVLGEIETMVDAERSQRNLYDKTLRLLMEKGDAAAVREYAKAANAELKAKGMKELRVPKKFQETPEEIAAREGHENEAPERNAEGAIKNDKESEE